MLGIALGMDREFQGEEAAVGPFSSDVLARYLGRDRLVIIENQLEATNHDQLGGMPRLISVVDAFTDAVEELND